LPIRKDVRREAHRLDEQSLKRLPGSHHIAAHHLGDAIQLFANETVDLGEVGSLRDG
jgi:hypothetical protein